MEIKFKRSKIDNNMNSKKNFVLDTNVILHDYKCIHNFEENDIYIPMVVLEELDRFKKGNEQINYNAREFARELDFLANEQLFKDGVEIGEGMGKLYIHIITEYPSIISKAFLEKTPDHSILAAALQLKTEKKYMKTILVSKDTNLRMSALLGILRKIISTIRLPIIIFDKNHEVCENVSSELIDELYDPGEIPVDSLSLFRY